MARKITLGLITAAGIAGCVFLIVVMVRQGVDRSGAWAAPLAALAGVAAAVAAVWGPVAWPAKVPVPPELEVPDWVVGRPVELAAVVRALDGGRGGTVGITTGLYGAGGFGKTTLVRVGARLMSPGYRQAASGRRHVWSVDEACGNGGGQASR